MSSRPGIVLYARLIPLEGMTHEDLVAKLYDEDNDIELKGCSNLPEDFGVVVVTDGEADCYVGISGDYGQLCIYRWVANDYCDSMEIKELQKHIEALEFWLYFNQSGNFLYSIHIGASFG